MRIVRLWDVQEAILKPHTQHLLQSLQRLVTAAAGASKGPLPRALKAKAKAKVCMKPFNGISRPYHRVIVWCHADCSSDQLCSWLYIVR